MKSTSLLASLGVFAHLAAGPALAGDHRHDGHGGHSRAEAHPMNADATAMNEVANGAAQGEPGHGWRYFVDSAAHRAVVISPQGGYYLSRGRGLIWVSATQKAA